MNQELKQRVIGAIVITALAAIFIPMLFDDPIDQGGQSVTELEIPPTPVNTGEVSANKLPTNSQDVLTSQEPSATTLLNTPEETELSSETIPPPEGNVQDESLDTGMVNEKNQVINSENAQPAVVEAAPVVETTPTVKPVPTVKSVPVVKPAPTIKPTPAVKLVPVVKETPTVIDQPISTEEPKKSIPTSPKNRVKNIIPPTNTSTNTYSNTETVVTNDPKVKPEFSRWTLQAGSFSKKENAIALMDTIKKLGLPVTLDTIYSGNNTPIYRLKVGPTLDKKRATAMKAKLDHLLIESLMIAE